MFWFFPDPECFTTCSWSKTILKLQYLDDSANNKNDRLVISVFFCSEKDLTHWYQSPLRLRFRGTSIFFRLCLCFYIIIFLRARFYCWSTDSTKMASLKFFWHRCFVVIFVSTLWSSKPQMPQNLKHMSNWKLFALKIDITCFDNSLLVFPS